MYKKFDILELIKKRTAVRKYQDKPIPKEMIDRIIEAGIWGPSVHHLQPWKFVVIENGVLIKKIKSLIEDKLRAINMPGFILFPVSIPLSSAKIIICVYNTKDLRNAVKRLKGEDCKEFEIAEISAISAAIQNMMLIAESMGIGSCWLESPWFCGKEISKLLNVKHELIAILTFGFPANLESRSLRKPLTETVKYIKQED